LSVGSHTEEHYICCYHFQGSGSRFQRNWRRFIPGGCRRHTDKRA